MGNSPTNAQNDWDNRGRWIDAADYDHLVTKFADHRDPEVIYVSGMISSNRSIRVDVLGSMPELDDFLCAFQSYFLVFTQSPVRSTSTKDH